MPETNDLESNSREPRDGEKELNEPSAAQADKEAATEPFTIFTNAEQILIVSIVGLAGLASPINSSIIFGAIPAMATSLHQSTQAITLTVTVYLIIQAISPSVVAGACDTFGRRPLVSWHSLPVRRTQNRPQYLVTLAIYLGSNIGLAIQNNYVALLVLRIVQSAGASPVIALGAGTISDLATPEKRGKYMAFFQLSAMLGPAFAPFLGAVFTQAWGWHAIFYFLVALSGLLFALVLLFLPETLRCKVGNGSVPAKGISKPVWPELKRLCTRRERSAPPATSTLTKPRPFQPFAPLLMLFQPDLALLLGYAAIIYSSWYGVSAVLATVYKEQYGLSELQIGLTFLSIGVGAAIGGQLQGRLIDRDFRIAETKYLQARVKSTGEDIEVLRERRRKRKDPTDLLDFPIEITRLRSASISLLFLVGSMIGLGWTLQAKTNLAARKHCTILFANVSQRASAVVLEFVVGLTAISVFTPTSVLAIDLYPKASASSSAANNLVRCLMAAAFTAFVDALRSKIGVGWTFTFFGILIALGSPTWLLLIKIGPRYRARRASRDKAAGS
jgi:MFS family permease